MISETLQKRLRGAKAVCVLTGAGISKESGVPTFRDKDGLWNNFRPEELANFEAFIANPDRVWEWYQFRRETIHTVQPNPGHIALVEFENCFSSFTLVTQNVDNLHRRAGSKNVLELHGNIDRNYCIQCKAFYKGEIDVRKKTVLSCKDCGGLVRPDIVWFGEMLPEGIMEEAATAAQGCDLFFSIGTSGAVYPAASLPGVARESGAYVVEINPTPTEISGVMNETLLGPSGEILPEILKFLPEQNPR